MSTAFAEKSTSMLPSEALNREFDLVGAALAEQESEQEQLKLLSTHAVLVGNIGLLLPNDELSELVQGAAVCSLPNTANWFEGVTTVRGNMVPVFDLHHLFSINRASEQNRLIVVGEGETAVAFRVDDFPRLVTLSEQETMTSTPPIPSLLKDHSREFYLQDNQVWLDWDVNSFFSMLGDLLKS